MTMMLFRLVLSLGFVALVLWFAARVARKRGLGGRQDLIEVLARQPMGRTSAVTVIRVAGRVMVVGSTEAQITLLGDMDSDEVDEHLTRIDADDQMGTPARTTVAASGTGLTSGSVFDRSQWSAALDGLREKTVRRS